MALFRSGKPSWRLGISANKTIAAGGELIPWDFAYDQDPDVWLAGAPTSVVVDRAGLYLVTVIVARPAVTVSTGVHIILRVNGVETAYTLTSATAVSSYGNLAWLGQLEEDDDLQVFTIGATATTSTILAGRTQFSGARVGPVRWTG